MLNRKEDNRKKVTRLLIIESFCKLICEKETAKITVTELCNKAQINRGTFYLYYKDIYDLKDKISEYFINDMKELIFPLFFNGASLADKKIIITILNRLSENKEITKAVLSDNFGNNTILTLNNIVLGMVKQTFSKTFKNKSEEDIVEHYTFVSGGCISLISKWVKESFITPIQLISNNIAKLVLLNLRYFYI